MPVLSILIRHGESIWNVTDSSRGLVTRFTGWADIPLTDNGVLQARAVGKCLDSFGIKPDAIFTSLLKRSVQTLEEIRSATENRFKDSTLIRSWRMNERHYGALMGLSKEEAQKKWGPIVTVRHTNYKLNF
jgi:2,3-bisphosphoglycerate-dependent phosphoglycerate mutase